MDLKLGLKLFGTAGMACLIAIAGKADIGPSFWAPKSQHVAYDIGKSHPTTFSMELRVEGPNVNDVIATGSTNVTGKFKLLTENSGENRFWLKETYTQGGSNVVEETVVSALNKATNVAGRLLFDDEVSLGAADGAFGSVQIPAGLSFSISDTSDKTRGLFVRVDGTLIMSGCEFAGMDLDTSGGGERTVSATDCKFRGEVLVDLLEEATFTTCYFPDNVHVLARNLEVDDSLFAHFGINWDGFCRIGGPVFSPGETYSISRSEFRTGDVQLYPGAATGSFSDNAFVNSDLAIRGLGATLPTVAGNSFFSATVKAEDPSITSMNLDGNYWGGRFGYEGIQGGWLDDVGSGSALGSSNTTYLRNGTDRVSTVPEDRPIPYIWSEIEFGNIVIGGRDFMPSRSNRECLVVCEVVFPGDGLPGASYELRCGGQTFSPDNPGFVARQDYKGDADPGSRTLNFILPADFTPATNRMELWIDASACSGWTNNQIWNSKNYYLNDFIFAQEPEPARPLRIGVVAACINVSGYVQNTDRGNAQRGRPSSASRVISRLKEDIATHWPLNDDEFEIVNLGVYNYEGGWLTSWLPQISSVGMMYSLAMELSSFLGEYNSSQGAGALDAIVCVVPGTSLGAANEGASLRGLRSIALVDEGSPGAAIHELGHALDLYTGTEQYNMTPGLDADGNLIVKDRGAIMQSVTAFNSAPSHSPAAITGGRIRHFPYGSTDEVYDFMGAKEPHWIAPSTYRDIRAALISRLGYKTGAKKAAVERKGNPGDWPLQVGGLYRIYWHEGRGEWDTEVLHDSLNVSAGSTAGWTETANAGAWLNIRVDGLNAGGAIATSILCRATDFGQVTNVWYPWHEIFTMPASVELCKVWHVNTYGTPLDLLAVRAKTDGVTNSLSAAVENTSTGQNVTVSWTSSTGPDPVLRFDRNLYFSTNGADWTDLRASFMTNRFTAPAEQFGSPAQIWFRLVTSDGFGETASQTGPIALQPQPPLVSILNPWDGDSAPTGTLWRLAAETGDLLDGIISNATWISSLQGPLGSGLVLEDIVLAQGAHAIRCYVTNSSGLSATGSVTVSVLNGSATSYDLQVRSNAFTCLPAGGDPAYDATGLRLATGATNILTLALRNQGIAHTAQVRMAVTEFGQPEQVLMNTNLKWNAFEEHVWAWNFVPTSRLAHTVRAELNAVELADPNPANNVCVWILTNMPPVARAARIELRQNELPHTNRLWAYDANGDPMTYSIVSQPASGTVTLDGSNFVYAVSTNWQGTATFQFRASDGMATSAPVTVTMVVWPCRKIPVLTSGLSTNGTQGQPFTYQITATNDPVQFTATSLPAGLGVIGRNGMITGTPAVTGTRYITIGALNLAGSTTATLTAYFAPGWPAITSALSAAQFVNQPFAYQIQANNSPTWYGASGLPAGLGVQNISGWITGVCSVAGTYADIPISASNIYGTTTAWLTINIVNPSSSNDFFDLRTTLTGTNIIVNGTTAAATRETGEPYHAGYSPAGSLWWTWTAPRSGFVTISATSEVFDTLLAAYTGNALNSLSCVASNNNWRWDSNSLLFFQAVSGAVYQIAIDGDYSSGAFGMHLTYRGAPLITNTLNFYGIAGQPFNARIHAVNGPASYGANDLPAGLHVDTATGVITGTPSAKTAQYVYLKASNSSGTDTSKVWFTIYSAQFPVFTNSNHASGTANSNFAFQLQATYAQAGTYSAWPLPAGLSVNANDGWITGTPYIGGIYAVPVSVQNSSWEMATNTLYINIRLPYADWLYYHFTMDEINNHPEISGPDADPDGDSIPNSGEHYCGTDPRDADSVLQFEGFARSAANGRVVEWQSVEGHFYQVGAASNVPGPYTVFTNQIMATPPANAITDTVQRGGAVIYRVTLEP